MTDPISDSFLRREAAPSAGDGGYTAQVVRYERLLGWVLWSGLVAVLVVVSF